MISLSRYEDIVIDGEVVEEFTLQGENRSIRAKKKDDHVLVLIADYSTYQSDDTVVDVPVPSSFPDAYKDVETGESVIIGKPGRVLRVRLTDRRVRILYGGPGWE